jgi:Tol biopolymer transport system component
MISSWRWILVATAGGLLMLSTCERTRSDSPAKTHVELAIKEQSLGKPPTGQFDEATGELRVTMSPDARRIVYKRPAGTGFVVVVDGVEWPRRYARIVKPVFSSDGKRVACLVSAKGGWQLVVDGNESGAAYSNISDVHFSPDGRPVLEVWETYGKPFFVIDGKELGRKTDNPNARALALTFSADGKHYAYVAEDGQDAAIILDGKTIQTFRSHDPFNPNPPPGVGKLWFTESGRLVYWFRRSVKAGYTSGVIASSDGRELATYGEKNDQLSIERVHWSANNNCIAALVTESGRNPKFLSWNSETLKLEATLDVPTNHGVVRRWYTDELNQFQFSPDGKRFGFIRPDEQESRLVIDGKEVTTENHVWNFAFSPDSKRLAYTGDMGLKPQLVVDGKTVEKTVDKIDRESRIFWSPNSKHLAVLTGWTPSQRLFVDGVEGPPFRLISEKSICFSVDGERLAYTAQTDGHYCVVTDGVQGEGYAAVQALQFSPDGKHVVYQAKRKEMWVLVVDGVESRERYDTFVRGLTFDGSASLHTLGQRNGEYFRVEVSITAR